ncbi:MAG: hypothetical protein ACKO96_04695 [Flammeovirgaceae bacterium]
MKENFKIEMGGYREDYSIFYSEFNGNDLNRELTIGIDMVKNAFYYIPFFKTTVLVDLNSFRNWNATQKELTFYEYTVVLKRVYNFLRKMGYNVNLD